MSAFYKNKETGAVVLAEQQKNGEVLGVEADGAQFVGDFAAFETAFDLIGFTRDDLQVAGVGFPEGLSIVPAAVPIVAAVEAVEAEEAPADE